MKVRDVVIYSGERFEVPQSIQRIDHLATHGWQLRYGGTKFFSDSAQPDHSAGSSLAAATKILLERVAKLPAPSRLQREPSENKTSDLPVGISGPIVRLRKGAKVRDCSFGVLLPRFGQPPRRRSVYIATENTYSAEKYNAALAKAIKLREQAETLYRREATRARRVEAAEWQANRVAAGTA